MYLPFGGQSLNLSLKQVLPGGANSTLKDQQSHQHKVVAHAVGQPDLKEK
jgi:hypothetical protein